MDGKTYTEDKIPLGTDVLLEEKNVPDYWLSSKSIPESDDVIKFFTEYEVKLDLSNYYNITQMDAKLQERQKAFKHMTGSDIEIGSFTDGEIIFCTASSDFFTANNYYVYSASTQSFNKINLSNAITITPSISSFSFTTTPSNLSVVEVGQKFTLNNVIVKLKKYTDFTKVQVHCYANDTTLIWDLDVNSSTITKTINQSILKKSISSFGLYANGFKNDTNISSKTSSSIDIVARQYYGVAYSTDNQEVLDDTSATNSYKSIAHNTNEVKTYLQTSKPSTVILDLPNTPTYIWFLLPSGMNDITKMTSGGFDFPFIQQDNVTITNQYNIDIKYKVYRSANKVYGTVTINLS